MAETAILNYDDLDNVAKLQKSQRFHDIMKKVDDAMANGADTAFKGVVVEDDPEYQLIACWFVVVWGGVVWCAVVVCFFFRGLTQSPRPGGSQSPKNEGCEAVFILCWDGNGARGTMGTWRTEQNSGNAGNLESTLDLLFRSSPKPGAVEAWTSESFLLMLRSCVLA